MRFKYSLEKGSRKFNCPNCNKRTFVRYMNNETGEYLSDSIGRCDRESKCRYHKKPNDKNVVITPDSPVEINEPSYHFDNLIIQYGKHYNNNNFISFLRTLFSVSQIETAIKKYFIGTSSYWPGATIFWQVDQYINVCAGKVMLYNANSGKRVKEPYIRVNWMHKILQIENFTIKQCLFGLHNFCDWSDHSIICIVESEKTAIIMSIIFPEYQWVATGNKCNFKEPLLQPIKKFKIIAYPDKTEFDNWNTTANILNQKGYRISCSSLIEEKAKSDGDDLIDFILENDFLNK